MHREENHTIFFSSFFFHAAKNQLYEEPSVFGFTHNRKQALMDEETYVLASK